MSRVMEQTERGQDQSFHEIESDQDSEPGWEHYQGHSRPKKMGQMSEFPPRPVVLYL